jgi:drug/metabolite transporter (DMT)-like permease
MMLAVRPERLSPRTTRKPIYAMKVDQSRRFSGSAFLLGSVLCWGSVPVLLRSLTDCIDAWTANGVRYPMTAVLYWPILIIAYRWGHLNRDVVKRCVVPAVLTLCGQVFWGLAPYHLPASAIGFFVRAALVWTLIGAMVLFPDERQLLTRPRFGIGLILTVIGFIVLSINKLKLDAEVTGAGIAIILACSFFFGLYGVSVRRCMRGLNPIVAFGVVSQMVSFGTISAMLVAGNYTNLIHLEKTHWIILMASSLLGIALGHAFLYSAIKRLGAAVTSGAQTLTPLVTAVLASLFLAESMSPPAWWGGIAMVIGALCMLAAQNRVATQTDGE